MPTYRFVGDYAYVLHGLSVGVNATVHREQPADTDPEVIEDAMPDGSTVVAMPGDEIVTEEPYPHPFLVNVDTGDPDVPPPATEESEPVSEPEPTPPPAPAAAAATAKAADEPPPPPASNETPKIPEHASSDETE
jgi:hypothetical protein